MKSINKTEPEKKEIKDEIELRIKDYDLVLEYFKSNDYSAEQINKVSEDKKILIECLDKINKGEKIDEKIIPKEITPEYIYGYTNEERIKKYYDIILKIIEEKKKLKDELNNEIKELKKLNENQISSMEKDILSDFENLRNKKEKYDQIINILKQDFMNKWIPAPLYCEKTENIKLENINEEIPENTLRVEFRKTDYIKNKKLVIIAELIGTKYKEEWEQISLGDWSHEMDFHLTEDEYKDISNKTFYFQVIEKLKGNKTKFKGEGKKTLECLKNSNEFQENLKFELKSKRLEPHVDIVFKIRKCIETKYESFQKRIFCFTKFYPPFKAE